MNFYHIQSTLCFMYYKCYGTVYHYLLHSLLLKVYMYLISINLILFCTIILATVSHEIYVISVTYCFDVNYKNNILSYKSYDNCIINCITVIPTNCFF